MSYDGDYSGSVAGGEEKMGIFLVKFELRSFDIIVSSADYLKWLWVFAVTYSIKKEFWRRRITREDVKTI